MASTSEECGEPGRCQDIWLDGEDQLLPDLPQGTGDPEHQIANPGEEGAHQLRHAVQESEEAENPRIWQELRVVLDAHLGRLFGPGELLAEIGQDVVGERHGDR